MSECLAESEHGKIYAFFPPLMANYVKLVLSARNDVKAKLWGLFTGLLNWITYNWMDRSTGGGKYDKAPGSVGGNCLDPNRGYAVTSQFVQMNFEDSNLLVCFCHSTFLFVFLLVC